MSSFRAVRLSVQVRVIVALALGVSLIAAGGLLTGWSIVRLDESSAEVEHAMEVLSHSQEVLHAASEVEADQRGYLLTSDPGQRERMREAGARLGAHLDHVRALVGDNPAQLAAWEGISALATSRVQLAEQVADRHAVDPAAALVLLRDGRGAELMRAVYARVGDFQLTERSLLAARQRARNVAIHRTFVANGATALGGIALVGLAGWVAVRENRRRARAAADLHAAMDSLRDATAERDRFFSLSLDMMVIASVDGYFKFVSPAATAILGWSADELTAQPFLEFVHPEERASTLSEVDRQIRAGEPVLHFDNRYRHKDGTWRVLSWQSVPGPNGLMYAIARDVTAQRAEEAERDRLTRELRLILDTSGEGIYGVDLEHRCTFVSKVAAGLLGYEPAEIIGVETHALLHHHRADGTDLPVEECASHRAMRTGEPVHVEGEVFWRKDGSSFAVEYRAAPMVQDGHVSGVVVSFNDITERMRVRAALEAATAAADEANRAKSRFLANMSHELRTPLNAIIGFSEMLGDGAAGALNERQARYASNILESGHHLLALINDILDLAKIESGRLEVQLEPFDLGRTIDDVLSVVSSLAMKKRITLAKDVARDLPPLIADQSKVKQMLYNLLSNAVKFTREGGSVTVRASLEGPQHLRVGVSDTGIGIRPADHDRVWREFEQIDSSYARTQEGTGLGLALTRRIVALHGGRIWLESDGIEGQGSTFTFELPLQPAVGERNRQPGVHPEPSLQPRSSPERPLVLAVEDDDQAFSLIDDYLRSGGYDVAHARTAAQALEQARMLKPSAITLDILLPDQPGWDLVGELRLDATTRDIPIVVVSVTDDKRLALSLGVTEFLVKPVGRAQLLAALARACRVPEP